MIDTVIYIWEKWKTLPENIHRIKIRTISYDIAIYVILFF